MLGIAGESGCGKSTLAYALTRMLKPPALQTSGSITFFPADGRPVDMMALGGEELRQFRWNKIAMVFQSAMNALNPVTSLARQFDDIFEAHRPQMDRGARQARARELLEMVGIDPARISGFAHELSGGMRQRVMIAMALALEPEIVIMDEPTTALDVVVQREILDEIERLREELGFSVIFITHDLSLLLEVSDRLAVMYAGEVIERAPVRAGRGGARAPVHAGPAAVLPGHPRRTPRAARGAGQPARSPHRHSRLPVPAPLRLWVRGLRGHPPGAASPGCPGQLRWAPAGRPGFPGRRLGSRLPPARSRAAPGRAAARAERDAACRDD